MPSTALAPLAGTRDLLEVVKSYDPEQPYHLWKPQILMPVTLPAITTPVIFAVLNYKGGAGKTTATVELGAAWAARGYRVRLIDADPQGASMSAWLKPVTQVPQQRQPGTNPRSLADVYNEECSLDEATWPTRYDNLHIVPSYSDLLKVEYNPGVSESSLRIAVEESAEHFDITLIDCAPGVGKLSISALLAAQKTIVPLATGGLDALGMAELSEGIQRAQRLNPRLEVRSVILTAWEKSGFGRDLGEQIARDYPTAIVAPVRRTIRAAEAPVTGLAIRDHDPRCTAASDYDQLADIIIPARVHA
jgi:chromosome partitioning protein